MVTSLLKMNPVQACHALVYNKSATNYATTLQADLW